MTGVLSPSSTAAMLDAIKHAHSITFSAFILKGTAVMDALEEAAARGAGVHVRLDGFGGKGGSLRRGNLQAAHDLRKAGADAQVVHLKQRDGPQLHLKAAICDGVAYLDDCNWRKSDDTVVRDTSPQDAAALTRAALYERGSGTAALAVNKTDALEREVQLLAHARAGSRVDVETESIGTSSPVYSVLLKLVARGVHCRLLANYKLSSDKQRIALGHLVKHGVDARGCAFTEKFATVDSGKAWIGSSNATSLYYNPDNIDWGATTRGAGLVRELRQHFAAHWRTAEPVQPS